MPRQDRIVHSAQIVVRVASIANRVFLASVVVGMLASWILVTPFAALLTRWFPDADLGSSMTGCRVVMVLGITMSLATDRLLRSLDEIIRSTGAGDPFVGANARRLRTIGWCLLVLQLMEIPGMLIARYYPGLGSAAPSGDVSIAGWIAVLMVFVLSRVFDAGAMMRDDLAGTV